jgi:colanic acid/amylovoran biosynthesis protein
MAFTGALQDADLLLICGAGGFYDGCQVWNLDILDLVEAAIQRTIPVAMLGQGFGPLSDPLVVKRAAKILPLVNFITLRGGRGSLDLLRSLGIPESKVQITGDEAVELAFESRSGERGQGLGVNLRYGASATTDDDDVENIRPVLQDIARRYDVPLIPLPIAIQIYTRDDLAIKKLLSGFDEQSDGGKTLDSPLKVIQQVSLCRVVVTGAYHAAVFALAQGIPVVTLAKSAYFSSKLLGLEDQFGEGCQTIFLNEPALSRRLYSAIERAWENADELREPLQAAARRQVGLSRGSYERVKDLVVGCSKTTARHADIQAALP